MRPIDADALYESLWEAGMVFALRMVEIAPTIAEPPNDPLTLSELREMDGEPIYVTGIGWEICRGLDESTEHPGIIINSVTRLGLRGYGTSWAAYRRKPEGNV